MGGEAADFVPFFSNYGINTVILRNRLRADGYVAEVDAVRDAQQAVRVVRAYAKEWGIDPKRIGVMGFSAGAELAAPAAVLYEDWDRKNSEPSDPFAGISSRPDFVGLIYPGPTPFARNRTAPPIPKDVPPAFLACGSAGDRVHTVWALEYYQAMLAAGVPNVEMHLYGNGRHPGDPLPDGSRMSGGLTDRDGIPYGTWQYRFIDWARDLGFLQKPGIETKAAKDVAAYVADPPRPLGQGRGGDPAAANPSPEEEPPYKVPEPAGWAKETFPLPPAFAPGVNWKGVEELRFAPDWMKADADTFFSYAMLFWLSDDQKVDAATFERRAADLLPRPGQGGVWGQEAGRRRRRLHPEDQAGRREARQPARRRAGRGVCRRVEVDRTVHHRQAPDAVPGDPHLVGRGAKHRCIFIAVSPRPETAAVWKTLREIRAGCTSR